MRLPKSTLVLTHAFTPAFVRGLTHAVTNGVTHAVTHAVIGAVLFAFPVASCAAEPRFYPLDIYVVTSDTPLSAWQVEVTFPGEGASAVGVEGGAPPFSEPPYYDPRGLQGGKLVLAGFTLDPRPPRGRVKVATVHVRERKKGAQVAIRLVLAADPAGRKFSAVVETVPSKGETR